MMRIRRYLALGARCVGGARALSWQAAGTGPKVSGAASASLKDGRVLLWGGLDEARNAVDSLYAFEDGAWTPVETTGFKPQKAMYAAAATQSLVGTSGKEEFVVCGGWDPGEKGSGGSFSDAVHALDVNKLEWQKDDPLPCGPVYTSNCRGASPPQRTPDSPLDSRTGAAPCRGTPPRRSAAAPRAASTSTRSGMGW